jgi:excisionase family DNA binding protein
MIRDDVDEEAPTEIFLRPTVRSPVRVPTSLQGGLWDASDVAAYLKVSRSWVYHRAEAGQLPCVRVGGLLRFDPSAICASARGEAMPNKPVVAFAKMSSRPSAYCEEVMADPFRKNER